jgi:hypothetical protein
MAADTASDRTERIMILGRRGGGRARNPAGDDG